MVLTVQYYKKPKGPMKLALWLIRWVVRGLIILARPSALIPVAAFVAGFVLAVLLWHRWSEGDRELIRSLEERLRVLEQRNPPCVQPP